MDPPPPRPSAPIPPPLPEEDAVAPTQAAPSTAAAAAPPPAAAPAPAVASSQLEQSAWRDQKDRLLGSARYQLLVNGAALDESVEPVCVERAIVAAVAPERTLGQVLQRIPDVYAEVIAHTRGVVEGVPALRVVTQKCTNPRCDNEDPNEFRPSRGGAVACMRCGDCQSDFVIHEGEMYRHFSDSEDRSHHGPALNPLYSASYNLGTQFSGFRGQKRNTGRETDFSVSNIGKDVAGTRVEYKDDQKSKAFRLMREQGANLVLHDLVRKKAEELFAAYRDARDRLYDFEAVVAACLIAGHLEVLLEEGYDADGGRRRTFQCPACGMQGFTAKRDADKHCTIPALNPSASGDGQPAGGGGSGGGSQGPGGGGIGSGNVAVSGVQHVAGRKTSSEMPQDPEVHKMTLAQTRALLEWVAQGRGCQRQIDGVCKGLQKELRALQRGHGAGTDDDDSDAEAAVAAAAAEQVEEGEYKAGQLLVMTSLKQLTAWCGGDGAAAKLFFDYLQGVKKRKAERDALLEEEEQDRKRRRLQEKPLWEGFSET